MRMHPDRVHIVPVQHEYDRVVEPLLTHGADVVYLLYDSRSTRRPTYYDDIEADLEASGHDLGETVHVVACDHGDPYAVFGLVTTLAAEHENDSVAVNVATGSKLAAIGAAMGCMDEDTDARAYFPHATASAYDGQVEPATTGYDGETHLIDYPIQSPTRQQVAMLAVIATRETGTANVTKRTLIDSGMRLHQTLEGSIGFAEQLVEDATADDDTTTGSDRDRSGDPQSDDPRASLPDDQSEVVQFEDLSSDAKKGAYGSLKTHVLDPLVDRGYVEVESIGRSDRITLTDSGRHTLQAFRHKVTDVIRNLTAHYPDRTNATVPAELEEGLDERSS